jgi:hypothetical protein
VVEDGATGARAEVQVERLRPILEAELLVEVEVDASGDGAGPLDVVRFDLVVRNRGEGTARQVTAELPLPAHTSWVEGPLLVDESGASPGGAATSLDRSSRLAQLLVVAPGSEQGIAWRVQIDGELPALTEAIEAQAIVRAEELDDRASDDPRLPGAADPTVLPLTVAAAEIPSLRWYAAWALALALAAVGLHRSRAGA